MRPRGNLSDGMIMAHAGLTVIEMLITIAVIGLLIAIILPAVQSARESARKASCKNNLRQIGIAMQSHDATHGHFPSNGWGYRWMGEPAGGIGVQQPGGWVYGSLDYLEQPALRRLGSGSHKQAELTQAMQTPLPVFHCPSRRKAAVYPFLGLFPLRNVPLPAMAAKCDYAGNGGETRYSHPAGGPSSIDSQTVAAYRWPDTSNANGVFFVRSAIRAADITDGLSQCYLVGEKCVSTRPHDPNNPDRGDDQTLYMGDDKEIRRWTDEPPRRDSRSIAPTAFGSAHASGCQFAFADGSVRLVSFSIDADVHRKLGNRGDGAPLNPGEL
jgi:prepilin-type N-terminal cleavage/methylation domain-containing protein/prepilin-type processing-associated H-X9-DG protein